MNARGTGLRAWAVVGLAVAVAGCGYLEGGYTAEGILSVGPEAEDLEGGTQTAAPRAADVAAELKSEAVLERALDEVPADDRKAAGYAGVEGPARLAEDLAAEPLPNSTLVRVALTSSDAAAARTIVTHVMDAYVAHRWELAEQAMQMRTKDLVRARNVLSEQAEQLRSLLAGFLGASGLVIRDGQDVTSAARVEALAKEHASLTADLSRARAEWERFAELANEAQEADDLALLTAAYPGLTEPLSTDPSVMKVLARIEVIEAELQQQRQSLGPDHSAVKRLAQDLEEARDALDDTRAEVLAALLAQKSAILQSRLETLRKADASLRDELAHAREVAAQMDRKAAEYEDLRRRYESVQEQLDALTEKVERLRMEAVMSRPDVRVVQYPSPVGE